MATKQIGETRRYSGSLNTFNALQTYEEEADHEDAGATGAEDDDHEMDHHEDEKKKEVLESFDFNERESIMWRKHQFRRYYQGKGKFWTSARITTCWKWLLVILTGLLVAFTGAFVAVFTETLTDWKFETCYKLMEEGNHGGAFFAFQFMSMFLVLCAGALCWREPAAAGSGIPEIKAFLNGVNLNNVVRVPVLVAKVIGMCFSCSAGLPLGKEGPMIHAGSIIGAVVSQGYSFQGLDLSYFGINTANKPKFDMSWNTFQDLRNDPNKRDFVTFGAAAGVAAAFRAPIGGILFTLEEGASFWSTSTTFRSFVCAVITQLSIGLIFPEAATNFAGMFAFGKFVNYSEEKSNYRVYELPLFVLIGCLGGVLGALFNHINEKVSIYRKEHLNAFKWKRIVELVLITLLMSFISFILPMCWTKCTPLPAISEIHTPQEVDLIEKLVQFQCGDGYYNPLASLYFTSGDVAMRQLFHFRELDGQGFSSFGSGPLILFFIPYFLMAAITSGVLAPAGLFVPTLLSGAALGRLIGHWMNVNFPGSVADSGTYALIGAAAILGGMARMTIAGCIIILEACGNITYLLPLMVTFTASRYVGNFINESMYDMQIHIKGFPFLESSLHTLGMLNYQPISQIMSRPVITLNEIDKVSRIMDVLTNTTHNGFPVVGKDGKLRGLILRKTLLGLLKMKVFSIPKAEGSKMADGGILLEQTSTVTYDQLERNYPNYPTLKDIKLKPEDYDAYIDTRVNYDPSPSVLNLNTSIRKCYNLFRTMGYRHTVVIDGEMKVVGIITRYDMNEHRLHHLWEHQGNRMQKDLSVDILPPAIVYEVKTDSIGRGRSGSVMISQPELVDDETDPEIIQMDGVVSDSPTVSLRKGFKPK